MDFPTFFRAATGNSAPYDYQYRLACGPSSGADPNLTGNAVCSSQIVTVPTGLGKTAAVVMAWLWNRLSPIPEGAKPWPRRLVYCLPMRTLVDQTRDNVTLWLENLWKNRETLKLGDSAVEELRWLAGDGSSNHPAHSPLVLMGGETANPAQREWDLHPERPCILIGIQDMLLSRALNRGYGMSRYRWPMHFALLNNDCLWVLDEIQLMGVGVETGSQLQGFRNHPTQPPLLPCCSWWMSATLNPSRLETVDHPRPAAGWPVLTLTEADLETTTTRTLLDARKPLSQHPLALSSETKNRHARAVATLIRDKHQTGSLTLVVVNRVSRAREIYEALTTGKSPLMDTSRVGLIHSRFRPMDRARLTRFLLGDGDRIVIATQAIEAGVDVSARVLITELAPWSSMVQRFGRCNRRGTIPDAEVLWIDIQPKDDSDDLCLPYSAAELSLARAQLGKIVDAGPNFLTSVGVAEPPVIRPILRRRDLLDLFDTTPDLCGQDLDVSRYIRDGEDKDVQFYWRDLVEDTPSLDEPPPDRDELCRVSLGDAEKFLTRNKGVAWQWNPVEARWVSVTKPRPGSLYLLATAAGGYHENLGWTGDPKQKPSPLPSILPGVTDANDSDPDSFIGSWQSVAQHTSHVVRSTTLLGEALKLAPAQQAALRSAALWHDVGKAHEAFQRMIRGEEAPETSQIWAKSPHRRRLGGRRGFRHELASALAWLLTAPADTDDRDLIAYLIAAHHGKVRLSIRSLPIEEPPEGGEDRLFARGVIDGDQLPAVSLGEIEAPPVTLDLSFMRLGEGPHGPSWLARSVALRDRIGPFGLAFLESVLRAADARASQSEG